ncbi:hypothetical protein Droror1_Dr00007900 [Drosera rotundifolia]
MLAVLGVYWSAGRSCGTGSVLELDLAAFSLTPPPRLLLQPSLSVSLPTDFTHHNHCVSLLPQPPDPPSPATTTAASPFDEQQGTQPGSEGALGRRRRCLAQYATTSRGAAPLFLSLGKQQHCGRRAGKQLLHELGRGRDIGRALA